MNRVWEFKFKLQLYTGAVFILKIYKRLIVNQKSVLQTLKKILITVFQKHICVICFS